MRIKKSVFVSLLVICSLLFGSIGVFAASGIESIKAALNHNIKFILDGSSWTPKDPNGNKMSALVYKGSTYVPLRAVSEALDAELDWDNDTSTIIINKGGNEGIPYNDDTDGDNSGSTQPEAPVNNTPAPATPTPATSSTSGKTIATAIPYGKSITYEDPYSDDDGLAYTSNLTVSVTSAKPISRSQIAALGFEEPKADAEIEYKLVKLKVIMKNGKLISEEEGGYSYYVTSLLRPRVWGSNAADKSYIIGSTAYGFTGSLNDAYDAATENKLTLGKTESYTAEGSIILPVTKGSKSYLTLQLQNTDDYNNSFIYLALE